MQVDSQPKRVTKLPHSCCFSFLYLLLCPLPLYLHCKHTYTHTHTSRFFIKNSQLFLVFVQTFCLELFITLHQVGTHLGKIRMQLATPPVRLGIMKNEFVSLSYTKLSRMVNFLTPLKGSVGPYKITKCPQLSLAPVHGLVNEVQSLKHE